MSPGGRRLSFGRVPDAIFHGPLIFDYRDSEVEVKRLCRKPNLFSTWGTRPGRRIADSKLVRLVEHRGDAETIVCP